MCPCIFAKILKILKILKTKSEVSQPPSSIARLLKFSYFATTRQGQQDGRQHHSESSGFDQGSRNQLIAEPSTVGNCLQHLIHPFSKDYFSETFIFPKFHKTYQQVH